MEARKKMSILNSPEILTLQIKRFQFSSNGSENRKKYISYPEILNLRPYTVKQKFKN